ncbi:hypothetical protein QJN86_27085, partial [Escherichia coli]
QTLLGVSHSKDLAQSAAAVKDLVNYFNELYIIKVNSGKIGKTAMFFISLTQFSSAVLPIFPELTLIIYNSLK